MGIDAPLVNELGGTIEGTVGIDDPLVNELGVL